MLIYQKILRVFFFAGSFFFCAQLSALVDVYLGASGSLSQWQMGFASGKTVELFGKNQQSNKPDPLLYMAGVSASAVWNKTWALTYQGEIGRARPEITLSSLDDSFAPPRLNTLSATTDILRTDHSLAVSRTLGASGFSLYAGAKLQWFGYSQNDGKYVQTDNGAVVSQLPFSIEQRILNFGPAAGVTYMFRIFGKIFGAAQAGFIYFPGQYTASMAVEPNAGQKLNNRVDEKFYGLGATGLLSLIVPVSENILLQVAARGQYYYARTREGTTTVQTTSKTTVSPSATMDNVQDIMLGGQLAVICKIF